MKPIRVYMKRGNRHSVIITEPLKNGMGGWETKNYLYTKAGKLHKQLVERWEWVDEFWMTESKNTSEIDGNGLV